MLSFRKPKCKICGRKKTKVGYPVFFGFLATQEYWCRHCEKEDDEKIKTGG